MKKAKTKIKIFTKRLTTPVEISEYYHNLIPSQFLVNPKFKNQSQLKDLMKFTKLLQTPADKNPKN